jgi:ankyrin repeat protein
MRKLSLNQFIMVFSVLASQLASAVDFDQEGLTPLHRAAGRGDVELIRTLLRTESPMVLDRRMGVSVLHKAVYSGNAQAVRLILENGGQALINLASPSNGNTPLHDAVYFRAPDWSVLKTLLEFGPNIRIKNRAGMTPLAAAEALFQEKEPLQWLIETEQRQYRLAHTEFMDAVRSNNFVKVREIYETRPNFSLSDREENGFTPLIWAAREGFVELTAYFLELGADPNQLDEWMLANAGHKAAYWGRTETLKLLIDNGLQLNARGGYNGYTALHDAVVRQHHDAAILLLDSGASCFVEGHDGKTPLSIAQSHQNRRVLEHRACQN